MKLHLNSKTYTWTEKVTGTNLDDNKKSETLLSAIKATHFDDVKTSTDNARKFNLASNTSSDLIEAFIIKAEDLCKNKSEALHAQLNVFQDGRSRSTRRGVYGGFSVIT